MFPMLWIKIALSLGVLALVAGGYWYVSSLQNKVQMQAEQIVLLDNSNKELQKTNEEMQKQLDTIQKVTDIGDSVREENRKVRDKQLQHIDDGVKQGKDRPVGPLLKEFFNVH